MQMVMMQLVLFKLQIKLWMNRLKYLILLKPKLSKQHKMVKMLILEELFKMILADRRILAHPEMLDNPPEEVAKDID